MADRPVYVYELDVEIPRELGWPWEPDDFHVDHGCNYDCEFSWPSRRRFLSQSSANRRAKQMREWGATVTVRRSEPVRFTNE